MDQNLEAELRFYVEALRARRKEDWLASREAIYVHIVNRGLVVRKWETCQ